MAKLARNVPAGGNISKINTKPKNQVEVESGYRKKFFVSCGGSAENKMRNEIL